MKKILVTNLHGVTQTMLMTLYFHAVENDRDDGMFKDKLARELVDRIDYDFSKFEGLKEDQYFTAIRTFTFDQATREFFNKHPNGSILDLGCGLDTRFERLDKGKTNWFGLDLPEVIAIRQQLLPQEKRFELLAYSVFDERWIERIRTKGPTPWFISAQGLLMHLPTDGVKQLVLKLSQGFAGAELMFDAMSPLMVFFHNLNPALRATGTQLRWSLTDDHEFETWKAGIRLIDSRGYFDNPGPRGKPYSWMKSIPFLANGNRILRYRL